MSTEVLKLTENQIHRAFHGRDARLLEKETLFVLNHFIVNLCDIYSDLLLAVKPKRVKIKNEPSFLFKETYLASLKKMLSLSERLNKERMDFADVKLDFDTWFYEVTSDGVLICEYKPDSLVSITDAAKELGVSRSMIYKYIDRGLETVGEKGSQKIPRFILDAWKNPAYAFQMQWIHQVRKSRSQTVEEKLDAVNRQIAEYEKEYKGTFHQLYGHLSDREIDAMPDAADLFDWKELEEKKRRLLSQLNGGMR